MDETTTTKTERVYDPEKCQRCQRVTGEPEHTCPYQEEINDNHEVMCNCCDECRQQRVWDI